MKNIINFVNFQVCQKSDGWYDCGTYQQPIWLLNNRDPLEYRIEYPFGDTWRWEFWLKMNKCFAAWLLKWYIVFFNRVSMFSFREVPDQPITTVKYLGEINLQYVSELQVANWFSYQWLCKYYYCRIFWWKEDVLDNLLVKGIIFNPFSHSSLMT